MKDSMMPRCLSAFQRRFMRMITALSPKPRRYWQTTSRRFWKRPVAVARLPSKNGVASARRWFDTSAQTLNQEITTTWPAPALLDPVRITINALESSGEDDPGTLRMTVANPGPAIEVAFAGRDLQAGLCPKVSSTTIPVTEGTDRPGRMLSLAPGEAKEVSLKLDPSCFAEDSGSLMGTLIVARKGVVEYRAILQLGIPRSPQTGTK
ncbi:hypothetical protein K6V92_01155 [Cupriavidus respiraculi]|uniref:hypothetical protein n=1 Tax=Cupriavidus respiraculi TaxID=195930 RepID=UPI001C988718|nr:hypothetical protein [Cupriavidus respiraculi]MBY4945235.1 hypothetical protein [Cupriavidus respiraculi]